MTGIIAPVTLSRSARDQERLVDYVRRALQQLDDGETVDPVALCAEDPHLAQPLAEVLGLAADLPVLQQEALREDPLAGLVLAGRYRLDNCLGRGAALLDFGIAARASSERLTATRTTLGTPWYMPPEQVEAGAFATAAPTLDVYGLGATVYHLLARMVRCRSWPRPCWSMARSCCATCRS